MKVKGSAITVLPRFIKRELGNEEYEEWLDNLEDEAREIYRERILVNEWYPLKKIYVKPTEEMCDLFYDGDLEGAWELGRYSADYALSGIYRAFVRFSGPKKLAQKASRVFATYFEPSEMRGEMLDGKEIHLYIDEFPEIDEVVENRIMGWMQRCLELTGCTDVKLKIRESLRRGDDYTRIILTWN